MKVIEFKSEIVQFRIENVRQHTSTQFTANADLVIIKLYNALAGKVQIGLIKLSNLKIKNKNFS